MLFWINNLILVWPNWCPDFTLIHSRHYFSSFFALLRLISVTFLEFNCLKHFVLQQAESRWLLTISRALQPVLPPSATTSRLNVAPPRLPSASSSSSRNCLQLWLFPQKRETHTSILSAGRTSTTTRAAPGLAHTFHTSVFILSARINARLTVGAKHWQFVMLLLCIFRKKALFFIINVLEFFFPVIGSQPHQKHCPLPAEMSPECTFVLKMCVKKKNFFLVLKKDEWQRDRFEYSRKDSRICNNFVFFCLCYVQIKLVQPSLQNLSSLDHKPVILK